MAHPNRAIIWLILGTQLIICALCVFIPFQSSAYLNSQLRSDAVELSSGWMLMREDGYLQPVVLPYTMSGQADTYVFRYQFETPPTLAPGAALMLHTEDVGFALYIDNSCISCYPQEAFDRSLTTSRTIQFADLPADYAGEPLTLVITPLLGDAIQYRLQAPVLGEKASLLASTLLGEFPLLITLVLVFLASIVLLFITRTSTTHDTGTTYIYVCIFTILFLIYTLMTTQTLQIIEVNSLVLHIGQLLMMTILPIPALMIFYPIVRRKAKLPLCISIALALVNFAAQCALAVTGAIDLRLMIPATHAVDLISVGAIAYAGFTSLKENPKLQRLLLCCLPVMVSIVVDILRLSLAPQGEYPAIVTLLGLLFFIIAQLALYLREYLRVYRETVRDEVLHNLAYNDLLTGLKNRNAYELRINELDNALQEDTLLWCVVADINNLKEVNDSIGHFAGDTLITDTARLLKEAFGTHGDLYRTGGDEFIIFLWNQNGEDVLRMKHTLDESVCQYNKNSPQPSISVAVGRAQYMPTIDDNILTLVRRADTNMYRDKKLADCTRNA